MLIEANKIRVSSTPIDWNWDSRQFICERFLMADNELSHNIASKVFSSVNSLWVMKYLSGGEARARRWKHVRCFLLLPPLHIRSRQSTFCLSWSEEFCRGNFFNHTISGSRLNLNFYWEKLHSLSRNSPSILKIYCASLILKPQNFPSNPKNWFNHTSLNLMSSSPKSWIFESRPPTNNSIFKLTESNLFSRLKYRKRFAAANTESRFKINRNYRELVVGGMTFTREISLSIFWVPP